MAKRTNKVLLIYTGGTIGMGQNPRTGALEPLNFSHLLKKIPEYKQLSADVDTVQFDPPLDSSDMSPAYWVRMVDVVSENYNSYDGFVILHGTDTMAYTASALSFLLENLKKPVVLTGSQLPIGQLRTDGKENLISSLELASAYDTEGKSQRFASISTDTSSEETAQRSKVRKNSMPSTHLTTPIFAMQVLIFRFTTPISCAQTMTGQRFFTVR